MRVSVLIDDFGYKVEAVFGGWRNCLHGFAHIHLGDVVGAHLACVRRVSAAGAGRCTVWPAPHHGAAQRTMPAVHQRFVAAVHDPIEDARLETPLNRGAVGEIKRDDDERFGVSRRRV